MVQKRFFVALILIKKIAFLSFTLFCYPYTCPCGWLGWWSNLILAIFIHYKLQCATNYITTIVLIHKTTSEQKPSSSPRLEKSFRGQKKVSLVQVCSLWLHPYWPSLSRSSGLLSFHTLVLSLLYLPPGRFARREVSIGVLVAVLSV